MISYRGLTRGDQTHVYIKAVWGFGAAVAWCGRSGRKGMSVDGTSDEAGHGSFERTDFIEEGLLNGDK